MDQTAKPIVHEVADPSEIVAAAARLRREHLEILAGASTERVVQAIADVSDQWSSANSPWRARAAALEGPFGLTAVDITLQALMEGLTATHLNELLASESAMDNRGYPVIGHVIAGNTPLLSWTSMIRALLVRSASLVKLPSGPAYTWAELFTESLGAVDPGLARCITLMHWKGGNGELDASLCTVADLIVAYGSDNTISNLKAMTDGARFIGYDHRISFGIVLDGASLSDAAAGFATDILLYDQGGCLSPQAIFVEGDAGQATAFAEELARALEARASSVPATMRTEASANRVRKARNLARMKGLGSVWQDDKLRWTVAITTSSKFAVSPAPGFTWIIPIGQVSDLTQAATDFAGMLQGCAVATEPDTIVPEKLTAILERLGITYICAPGRLQAPPLSWPQDGIPVLQSLFADR